MAGQHPPGLLAGASWQVSLVWDGYFAAISDRGSGRGPPVDRRRGGLRTGWAGRGGGCAGRGGGRDGGHGCSGQGDCGGVGVRWGGGGGGVGGGGGARRLDRSRA